MNGWETAGLIIAALIVMNLISLANLGRNYMGPFKFIAPLKLANKDKPEENKGKVLFYGASNFTFWYTMQEDIPHIPLINHGFGGSTDKALVKYADKLLFPYEPKIVVFQTGSNDYVPMKGSDEEKIAACMEYKRRMFEDFYQKLPNAKFVVMSGLLLPGRSQYLELTNGVNRELKALCEERDYMTFVDASEMTYKDGIFAEELFVKDKIHLNHDGQVKWAKEYIIPALDELLAK